MDSNRTSTEFGIELPELSAAWTALENALNEVSKAREALDQLTQHEEHYNDGTSHLAYNDDIDKYMPLYTKLIEAERAAHAAQQIIIGMEYQRRGGLAGIFAGAINKKEREKEK